jgi:hypothetical protein
MQDKKVERERKNVSVQKVRSVGVKFWFDVAEAISLDM